MTLTPNGGSWFSILRCPYCRGGFHFEEAPSPALGAAEFGVLRCSCAVFPVVDGIPILQKAPVGMFEHTTGATEVAGVAVADVVRLIESGRPLDALLECIVVPVLPSAIRRRLPWRVANSRAMQRVTRSLGKKQLRKLVLERRDVLGVPELVNFFYRQRGPLQPAVGQYFMLRFCQPRHLAALALLAAIPSSEKPVLDIACGAGHFEHYLTERAESVTAIGTDMNFFQLWIARHWIAPGGRFVCANAQDGLPFASDALSATICSDAYHYIPNRRRLWQEIERCAPGRPVILTRVGNRAEMPNEGTELTVPEYLDEFGATGVRCFGESDLVRSYLRRTHPFAQRPLDSMELSESKWLSFAWNLPAPLDSALVEKETWPHAVGQIGINPIYRSTATKDGDVQLRFEFPLIWYAYENHQMLSYHPRMVTITHNQRQRFALWRDDPSLLALVESFALIGLPQRFYAGGAPS